MDLTAFVNQNGMSFTFPISLLLWSNIFIYALHIMEESVLGEVFVEKGKKIYWPQYGWKKFFFANSFLMIMYITSIILFEELGGIWIIFPLGFIIERILNGVYHLAETIINRRFSSGLISSVLIWIIGYFVVKYSVLKDQIDATYLSLSLIVGLAMSIFMIGGMLLGSIVNKSKLSNKTLQV